MRQRKPDRSKLKQSRSLGIEDAARDIDVRYGVSVEQNPSIAEVGQEGKD